MNIHSKEKDKKSKVYLILIIILLFLVNGALIYKLVKDQNEITKVNTEKEELLSEQQALETELEELNLDVLELKGKNQGLDSLIDVRDAEIARKSAQIKKMISGGNLTREQLRQARQELNDLKSQVAEYKEQIKKLSEENESLTQEVEDQNKVIQKLNEDYKKQEEQITEKDKRLKIAARLKALNLSFQGVKYRKLGGKEKEVSKFNSMEKLKVTFALDNNETASKGSKTVYLKIFSPEKSTLHNESKGSGSFKYKDEQSLYTLKEDFNFQNGNEEFTFYWDKMNAMAAGTYEVFLFCEDHIIGKQTLILK